MDPDVHRIINQHSLLPLKYFRIEDCDLQEANVFCRDMLERLQFPDIIEAIFQEYWILGETYVYAELDEGKGCWKKLTIQNPDYIIVKRPITGSTQYYLRPDENVRRIVFSTKPEDEIARQSLSQSLVVFVKEGHNIPLDDFYLSTFVRMMSPYEVRGTSPLVPLLGILTKPERTPEEMETIKSVLLDVEGADGVRKELLEMRLTQIMKSVENWINRKLLAPIAKIQGFKVNGECVHPRVKFDRVEL
jgi:hypothetical protein